VARHRPGGTEAIGQIGQTDGEAAQQQQVSAVGKGRVHNLAHGKSSAKLRLGRIAETHPAGKHHSHDDGGRFHQHHRYGHVAAGLGLAIVSRHALAKNPEQEGLCVLPVAGLPIKRKWQAVWRQDRRLPRVASVFMEFVQRQLVFKAGDHG
jgi:hypothetical protein